MQISKVTFTFSFLDQIYPFWANLVQKIKIVSLSWNMQNWRICRIECWCSFFCFRPKILLLSNFVLKNQSCKFRLNFGSYNDLNMQKLMVLFPVFHFRQGIQFLSKFSSKIKVFSLSWNLVPRLIWRCRIQCWRWFFPFFTRNTCFGEI